MKLCEIGKAWRRTVCPRIVDVRCLVDPDKVNWFVFDFEVRTEMFQDPRFVQAFIKYGRRRWRGRRVNETFVASRVVASSVTSRLSTT